MVTDVADREAAVVVGLETRYWGHGPDVKVDP